MDDMRKNKLFIILSIIISASLFATAAICNQCAAGDMDEPKIDVEEDAGSGEEAAEEEEAQEDESTEEEEDEEEQTQNALEEPSIKLVIYEGPVYSQADDVCYWRVKAIVTGVPTPVVEFNRDDSGGAWGSKKSQVNLANPTDSYSLSATATNSEGVATDSISLSWQCNRPPEITGITFMGDHFAGIEYTFSAAATDPDGDTLNYSWTVEGGSILDSIINPIQWTMPAAVGNYYITVVVDDGKGGTATLTETVEVTAMLGSPIAAMEIPIVSSEGGYIYKDSLLWIRAYHLVGDTNTNEAIKGYISFDISGLGGASIATAELSIGATEEMGDPSGFVPLWISSVSWEPGPIVINDFYLSGDPIQNFSSAGSLMCDSSKLKLYLQNAINGGRNRFQIMMFFTGMATDNDNSFDYTYYEDANISLYITYTP